MELKLRKIQVCMVALAFAVQSGGFALAETVDNQLGRIESELRQILNEKLKSLQSEVDHLAASREAGERQFEVLRHLSALQSAFDKDEEATATDQRIIKLLDTTKAHPRELIRLTLAHSFSRAHYQTPAQEAACKRTLRHLLNDVAGQDPCLQALVLTTSIGWFPWRADDRKRLIEALSRCNDDDADSLKIRMRGYWLASGYVPTNHILYQAPKNASFMQKAYDLAVQSNDPDSILSLARWRYNVDKALEKISHPTEAERFLLVLKLLAENIERDGVKWQVVSNNLRNSLFASIHSNGTESGIKLLATWSDLLKKVPQDPLKYPEESGLELTQCQIYLGVLHLEQGDYAAATNCFKDAVRRVEAILADCQKPDLTAWRVTAVDTMGRVLAADLEQDHCAVFAAPLSTITSHRLSIKYGQHFRSSEAKNLRREAQCGLAVIAAKQHNLVLAENLVTHLEDNLKSDEIRNIGYGMLFSEI
jgi:tetratricopeptide (TPR) repeat protein